MFFTQAILNDVSGQVKPGEMVSCFYFPITFGPV